MKLKVIRGGKKAPPRPAAEAPTRAKRKPRLKGDPGQGIVDLDIPEFDARDVPF